MKGASYSCYHPEVSSIHNTNYGCNIFLILPFTNRHSHRTDNDDSKKNAAQVLEVIAGKAAEKTEATVLLVAVEPTTWKM